MKIDRHNYEEYFLLYIDNELTVDQKKQVDLFVQENADLEEELIMLQQSRLIPEAIVFEDKLLLMKEESGSFINLNNYEEWLVLYVDNELTETEKVTIEKFAAAHPHVREELTLFQQTKLQPEPLSFPDKISLYRSKERVAVITMTWWRVAVAAILIIVAGITLYSVLSNKNDVPPQDNIVIRKQNSVKPQAPEQQAKSGHLEITKEKERIEPIATVAKKLRDKKQTEKKVTPSNDQVAVDNTQKRPVVVNEVNHISTKDVQINDASVAGKPKQIFNDEKVTTDTSQTPNLSEYASNTEHKKLRGLFRKATRFIERTSGINPANDDNKVLIGGMAINLK